MVKANSGGFVVGRGSYMLDGLFPNIPSLEDIAKDFIKKNKLPKPKRQEEVAERYIIDWDDEHKSRVVLYSETKGSLASPQPIYGGGEGALLVNNYYLEGNINGEKANLEASIFCKQSYSRTPRVRTGPQTSKGGGLVPEGGFSYRYFRSDKSPLWFVTDAKKSD